MTYYSPKTPTPCHKIEDAHANHIVFFGGGGGVSSLSSTIKPPIRIFFFVWDFTWKDVRLTNAPVNLTLCAILSWRRLAQLDVTFLHPAVK